jgi:ASPIC and UnbV/Secretion system C-terminal sorting domain/FG-GAP-like repeat/Ig-like domain CHU_C associated
LEPLFFALSLYLLNCSVVGISFFLILTTETKPNHMRKNLYILKRGFALAAIALTASFSQAQVSFTANGTILQPIVGSPYSDCAVDMNDDGLDDVVRVTSGAIYIDYQQPDGTFLPFHQDMTIVNVPSWSICAADIDGNGYTDLLFGNGSALSFVYASNDGTSFVEMAQPEYIFSQRTTFNDIDNDGNLDAFVCHDVAQSRPYRNVGGVLSFDNSLIQTLAVGGNYAAIWVDYDNDWDSDLYITKCRGGAADGDPQRINLLYRNNADGTFTSVGPEANMDDGDQSWATTFEDFDNDGDYDAFTVNHLWANRFNINNGDGTFTDIIGTTGINPAYLGAWNCDAVDFDNNGFIDIFSQMPAEMEWNNGNNTFTEGQLAFSTGGLGDFNNDGFMDVTRGSTIYYNNGNQNHWVKFDLEGINSTKQGIGARIEIHGSWGVQVREVRAGESFAPASTLIQHFGLGAEQTIDYALIKWPSGMITTIDNPAVDQLHTVLEAGCMNAPVAITANGPTQICEGQTVTLSAPAGATYLWSNGATTQTIDATSEGTYNVIVFDELSCASASNNINVNFITQEAPVVTLLGEETLCEGGTAVLSSTIGNNYQWSNGQTGQAIEVSQAGTYSVTIEGSCSGSFLTSNEISVAVLNAPEPIANDVTIGAPGSAILTALGNNLNWYASSTSTDVLASGSTFSTPTVDTQASYWVDATTVYGGQQEFGGRQNNEGAGGPPSTGGRLFFNATEPFTLEQVTVYLPAESTPGLRTVQLFDNGGNVINEMVLDLPYGQSTIDLNFDIPVGTGYQLGCLENGLYRNGPGEVFPYAIGTVGSIYSSTFTGYYYYFYNWKVRKPSFSCTSDRVEVTATVVGVNEVENPAGLSIYPNPAKDHVVISAQKTIAGADLKIMSAEGKLVQRQNVSFSNGSNAIVDLNGLAAGVYTLVLTKENQTSRLQFVKQ